MSAAYSCPYCSASDVEGLTVCHCGGDLTLLLRIDAAADAWFNRGLEAAAAGETAQALEWMAACCAARPIDAAAHRARARLWAQLRRWPDASAALERAAELEPDSPDLAGLRQAFDAAARRNRRKTATPAHDGGEK